MLARQTNYLYIYIYIMPATRCSGNRDLDLDYLGKRNDSFFESV